jgi:hypothetical protein
LQGYNSLSADLDAGGKEYVLLHLLRTKAISRSSAKRHVALVHARVDITHPSFW